MTGVYVYGSCVSRDTFPFLGEGFELVHYTARQSAISVGAPARGISERIPRLDSRFQDRVVRSDIAGDLVPALRSRLARVDLVVTDLVDERAGVIGVGGGYVTRLAELWSNGGREATRGAAHVPFGTDEHLRLWSAAWQRLSHAFTVLGLADRVVLLDTPWATELDTGDRLQIPAWMRDPAQMNALLPRYVEHLRGLGVHVVSLPSELAVSTPSHRWGPSPFHYWPPAYEWMAEQVRSRSREVGAHSAAPAPAAAPVSTTTGAGDTERPDGSAP